MDEEQKSEASREEQLGPYQLEEQVPQSNLSQGAFYRATHETSGATALVFKPADEQGAARPRNWRVRLISSASPGYLALEVEESPWSVAPDRHSVEALLFLFEGVREGVRRMARAFPDIQEPRPRWRLALASAAAVCTLLFALVRLAPVSFPPSGPEPLASTPSASMSDEVPTATGIPAPFSSGSFVDTTDAGESVIARPLPREPFKGQKRPPCSRYTEAELIGACWTPHELKAPCPDELYEYQGKCYVPAFSAKKPQPQSLGQ
ncbi:hypothetical protein [Archangium sp.]|uniref:hypothetical protein n=1 Tax=Archangium sp. TaxID=1872627 RepID=UPI002D63B0BD|nr:hypothetical protein [Archangium sp.]HYO58200.1 hypothetical protein [Archangium sp.]